MKKVVLVRREEPSRSYSDSTRVRYAECQKNHAASTGGHTVDGCQAFVSRGAEGTNATLACDTCGCHRNFHRKVVEANHR